MNPAQLESRLAAIVGSTAVISSLEERRTYESDGLPSYAATPGIVVLPETAEQVQRIVALCHAERVPFVARGSGTGLSGGALPVETGILIVLARMRRILEVDLPNQRVIVEPGVINLAVTREVAGAGFYYAPDPSGQLVCSIGGNVAENSGGAHCLKYGFTTHHVLGLEVVLPDGTVGALRRSRTLDHPGYDLVGAFVGSEGTLGIGDPDHAAGPHAQAGDGADAARRVRKRQRTRQVKRVSDIIAAGIVPGGGRDDGRAGRARGRGSRRPRRISRGRGRS